MSIEAHDFAVVAYRPDEKFPSASAVKFDGFYGTRQFADQAFDDMRRARPVTSFICSSG
jgi:hypothetical protein